jgi:RNA polymerase sigma factor (sigma-70 family)
MDDDELIRAARENEPYAGAFLVSVYGPKLAGYCRSIASDLSDTDREHVIAVGIERAVRRIETYDPARGSLLAWLRPFVRHATQDWRRSNLQLANVDIGALAEVTDIPAPSPPTAETVSSATEAVIDAIPKLSTADQIILVLRHYEMYSVQDTADILKITADACRQRHHRALKRLRRLLDHDDRMHHLTGETQ